MAALHSLANGRAGTVRACVKLSAYGNKAVAWLRRAEWIPAAA